MRRFAVVLLAVAALASGCSGFNDKRGRGDAPVTGRDDAPAEVINFPDQFANVANTCDGHGHRVYSTTRQAPPVVIDDPSCAAPPR